MLNLANATNNTNLVGGYSLDKQTETILRVSSGSLEGLLIGPLGYTAALSLGRQPFYNAPDGEGVVRDGRVPLDTQSTKNKVSERVLRKKSSLHS